jgi:hypothetical protein
MQGHSKYLQLLYEIMYGLLDVKELKKQLDSHIPGRRFDEPGITIEQMKLRTI